VPDVFADIFGAVKKQNKASGDYSDLKTYTTFLNAKAAQKLDLPEEAKEAIAVDDLTTGETNPAVETAAK